MKKEIANLLQEVSRKEDQGLPPSSHDGFSLEGLKVQALDRIATALETGAKQVAPGKAPEAAAKK